MAEGCNLSNGNNAVASGFHSLGRALVVQYRHLLNSLTAETNKLSGVQ
jgi:hypothetical protein